MKQLYFSLIFLLFFLLSYLITDVRVKFAPVLHYKFIGENTIPDLGDHHDNRIPLVFTGDTKARINIQEYGSNVFAIAPLQNNILRSMQSIPWLKQAFQSNREFRVQLSIQLPMRTDLEGEFCLFCLTINTAIPKTCQDLNFGLIWQHRYLKISLHTSHTSSCMDNDHYIFMTEEMVGKLIVLEFYFNQTHREILVNSKSMWVVKELGRRDLSNWQRQMNIFIGTLIPSTFGLREKIYFYELLVFSDHSHKNQLQAATSPNTLSKRQFIKHQQSKYIYKTHEEDENGEFVLTSKWNKNQNDIDPIVNDCMKTCKFDSCFICNGDILRCPIFNINQTNNNGDDATMDIAQINCIHKNTKSWISLMNKDSSESPAYKVYIKVGLTSLSDQIKIELQCTGAFAMKKINWKIETTPTAIASNFLCDVKGQGQQQQQQQHQQYMALLSHEFSQEEFRACFVSNPIPIKIELYKWGLNAGFFSMIPCSIQFNENTHVNLHSSISIVSSTTDPIVFSINEITGIFQNDNFFVIFDLQYRLSSVLCIPTLSSIEILFIPSSGTPFKIASVGPCQFNVDTNDCHHIVKLTTVDQYFLLHRYLKSELHINVQFKDGKHLNLLLSIFAIQQLLPPLQLAAPQISTVDKKKLDRAMYNLSICLYSDKQMDKREFILVNENQYYVKVILSPPLVIPTAIDSKQDEKQQQQQQQKIPTLDQICNGFHCYYQDSTLQVSRITLCVAPVNNKYAKNCRELGGTEFDIYDSNFPPWDNVHGDFWKTNLEFEKNCTSSIVLDFILPRINLDIASKTMFLEVQWDVHKHEFTSFHSFANNILNPKTDRHPYKKIQTEILKNINFSPMHQFNSRRCSDEINEIFSEAWGNCIPRGGLWEWYGFLFNLPNLLILILLFICFTSCFLGCVSFYKHRKKHRGIDDQRPVQFVNRTDGFEQEEERERMSPPELNYVPTTTQNYNGNKKQKWSRFSDNNQNWRIPNYNNNNNNNNNNRGRNTFINTTRNMDGGEYE